MLTIKNAKKEKHAPKPIHIEECNIGDVVITQNWMKNNPTLINDPTPDAYVLVVDIPNEELKAGGETAISVFNIGDRYSSRFAPDTKVFKAKAEISLLGIDFTNGKKKSPARKKPANKFKGQDSELEGTTSPAQIDHPLHQELSPRTG